jgi:hypothetical protein
MAIGDDAALAGYSLVSGSSDLVKLGFQEINRSRDYIAQLKAIVPVSKAAFRTAAGISSGTADPSGGADGDIYFQYT